MKYWVFIIQNKKSFEVKELLAYKVKPTISHPLIRLHFSFPSHYGKTLYDIIELTPNAYSDLLEVVRCQ